LPAFANASERAELKALVTGDAEKASKLRTYPRSPARLSAM